MRRWGPPWAGGKALGAEWRAAGESVEPQGCARAPPRGAPSGRGQRDSVRGRNVGSDAVFRDRGRANDAVFLLFACVLFACVYMGQRDSCEQNRRKRQPNGEGAAGRLRGEAHDQPACAPGKSALVQGGDGLRRGHRPSPTFDIEHNKLPRAVPACQTEQWLNGCGCTTHRGPASDMACALPQNANTSTFAIPPLC